MTEYERKRIEIAKQIYFWRTYDKTPNEQWLSWEKLGERHQNYYKDTYADPILSLDGIEIRADDQSAPAIKYVGDRKTLAIETQSDMFKPDSEGKHFVKVIPKGIKEE